MKILYDEICRCFPEVRSIAFDDNADAPYTLMTMLAEWLRSMPTKTITPELIDSGKTFTRWCESQPRGKTAADDMLTILTVGFYEELFEAEHTRVLLAKLISKEAFTQGAEYFKSWVGEKNYEEASKYFR